MLTDDRGGGAGTVLVIDDTADNLRVVVAVLEAYSFTAITARDGESGLERAKRARPDAILLDVRMPGIDGYETCRRLKADPATAPIPVLFMTVLSEPDQKLRAFEAGAVDHVTKPLEASELLARVRTHVGLRAAQLELRRQNERLEERVAERTAELARDAVEREQLLSLVRAQSDALRRLGQGLIDGQRDRDRGIARTLREHVAERLRLVQLHVEQAAALAARPATGDEVRAHLGSALELLRPAVTDATGVEQRLDGDDGAAEHAARNPLLRLSTREYEIVQLIARGMGNKEIAGHLAIAPTTVSTHRARIMEKLQVSDLSSLIRIALVHEDGG
jgi:FixJ family two-component response regulator